MIEITKAGIELEWAIRFGDQFAIERAALNYMYESSNFFEIYARYIALHKVGIHIDFGTSIIKKGTILYRVRKYEEHTDFSNPQQWGPPPNSRENRANREGEKALYCNLSPDACVIETHIKHNEKYVLARYECMKDIPVGGFLMWHQTIKKSFLLQLHLMQYSLHLHVVMTTLWFLNG